MAQITKRTLFLTTDGGTIELTKLESYSSSYHLLSY